MCSIPSVSNGQSLQQGCFSATLRATTSVGASISVLQCCPGSFRAPTQYHLPEDSPRGAGHALPWELRGPWRRETHHRTWHSIPKREASKTREVMRSGLHELVHEDARDSSNALLVGPQGGNRRRNRGTHGATPTRAKDRWFEHNRRPGRPGSRAT